MKIVVVDGYTLNPGDLSWAPLEALGDCTFFVSVADSLGAAPASESASDDDVLVGCHGVTLLCRAFWRSFC